MTSRVFAQTIHVVAVPHRFLTYRQTHDDTTAYTALAQRRAVIKLLAAEYKVAAREQCRRLMNHRLFALFA